MGQVCFDAAGDEAGGRLGPEEANVDPAAAKVSRSALDRDLDFGFAVILTLEILDVFVLAEIPVADEMEAEVGGGESHGLCRVGSAGGP
jgi:hypothetical protein